MNYFIGYALVSMPCRLTQCKLLYTSKTVSVGVFDLSFASLGAYL